MSTSTKQQLAERRYKTKLIQFLGGRLTPIILHNENLPCPLVALCNVLLLQGNIELSQGTTEVSQGRLLSLVRSCISNVSDKDAIDLLLSRLTTRIDLNLKFTRITDFEFIQEGAIFNLLNIPLYHGWIVDPQDKDTASAVGSMPYNSLVQKLLAFVAQNLAKLLEINANEADCFGTKTDSSSTKTSSAGKNMDGESTDLIANFLSSNASQLTFHGAVQRWEKFERLKKQIEEIRIQEPLEEFCSDSDEDLFLSSIGIVKHVPDSEDDEESEETYFPNYREFVKQSWEDKKPESAADAHNLSIEKSKYLGDDVEHTHLLKDFDYALLNMRKSEIVKMLDEDTDEISGDSKEDQQLSFPTAAAKDEVAHRKEEKPEEPDLLKYIDSVKDPSEEQKPDYEQTELGTFHAVDSSVEKSNFLEGDVKHTHLVKDFDYALLNKIKSEIVKMPDEDTEEISGFLSLLQLQRRKPPSGVRRIQRS